MLMTMITMKTKLILARKKRKNEIEDIYCSKDVTVFSGSVVICKAPRAVSILGWVSTEVPGFSCVPIRKVVSGVLS